MKRVLFYVLLYCLAAFSATAIAESSAEQPPLQKPHIDITDKASLQRGAKYFLNYCAGCHSLQYLRYSQIAKDIGLVTYDGEIDRTLVMNNLILTAAKIEDPITNIMPTEAAKKWFGVAPPDLTLEARVRGADWLYTYLISFYRDEKRPFGVNNWLFPDVAMPHVLAELQGLQIPVYSTKTITYNGQSKEVQVIKSLQLATPGKMDEVQFKEAMQDIVNFLVYTAEPYRTKRQFLGIWVLLFLGVLLLFAYRLKKEYWKDIK